MENKQIKEMSEVIASFICEIYRPDCDEYVPHDCGKCFANSTPIGAFAEGLYNAGYRKQSEGEWIVKGECWKTLQCSACGHTTDTIYDKSPFCPNCGAKMKGGAE